MDRPVRRGPGGRLLRCAWWKRVTNYPCYNRSNACKRRRRSAQPPASQRLL